MEAAEKEFQQKLEEELAAVNEEYARTRDRARFSQYVNLDLNRFLSAPNRLGVLLWKNL